MRVEGHSAQGKGRAPRQETNATHKGRARAEGKASAEQPPRIDTHPAAYLAHGLGVGGGGGEVALPVQPAKQAAPAVVPVGGVGQAPGHQRLALQEH